MKDKQSSPSVLRDLTAVAGLYRNVVWMVGQRMHRGPDWEQKVFDDAVRREEMAARRQELGTRR